MGRAKTGSHLERHGERWRVVIKVPPSKRELIGKAWLREALPAGTSAREAEALKWPVIVKLKKQIVECHAVATAPLDLSTEALTLRDLMREEEANEHPAPYPVADEIVDRAEELEQLEGIKTAKAFADIAHGRATPIRVRLAEWFERKRFSAGYLEDVERALSRFEVWAAKHKVAPTIEAVTVEVASRYVHTQFVKGSAHHKTANKDVSCLSSYWRYLGKALGRRTNPWAEQRIEAPSERHGPRTDKKRPFTAPEVVVLLTKLPLRREWEASMIAALSGMREDEIANLTVGDCADGRFNIGKSKTPAGVRKVPIHPALSALVGRLVDGKAPTDYLIGGLPEPSPGSKRGRGAPLAQAFTRARRLAGIDERSAGQRQSNVDFHSWRRWFIREAIGAFESGVIGFTPWTIARLVGHKVEKGAIDGVALPLGMTMGRYPGESSEVSLKACVEAVKLPDGAPQERPDLVIRTRPGRPRMRPLPVGPQGKRPGRRKLVGRSPAVS